MTLVATDVESTWESGTETVRGPVSGIAAWLTRSDDPSLPGQGPPVRRWL